MSYHAVRSPSGAYVWTDCTASPEAQQGRPNESSAASRHGTCGHQMGAECLEHGLDPRSYVGRKMLFYYHPESETHGEDWADNLEQGATFQELNILHEEVVTQELAEAVDVYVRFVRNLIETQGATAMVEQAVPVDHLTGETGATGTSDCVLLAGKTRISIDLKLGRGRVTAYEVLEPESYDLLTGDPVPPVLRMNLQCAMYASGSLKLHGDEGVERVKAIIVQPYLNAVSEYECDIAELRKLEAWIAERAEAGRKNPEFKPSSKNCFFCRARFDCHARNAVAIETALDGFEDITTARPKPISIPKLGDLYDKVEMIRGWCDDIEEKVRQEIEAERYPVRSDGKRWVFKEGRKPPRQWDDPEAVKELMRKMRIRDEVYLKTTLISPTEAEKQATPKKGKKTDPAAPEVKMPIGKVQWSKLAAHITQGDPAPVIALETDPRQRYVRRIKGFEEVPVAPNSVDDLL